MPSRAPNFSVPKLAFGETNASHMLPSLTAVDLTADVIAPRKNIGRSNHKILSGTYTCAVALMGMDLVNNGYTIGVSTVVTPPQVVPSGDIIRLRIPQPWTGFTGMKYAAAAAVFIQKGSADFRCVKFAFVDPSVDFSTGIAFEPLNSVQTIASADLHGVTASTFYGTRGPAGLDFPYLVPTTGGVRLRHIPTNLTISQDDIIDFDTVTARATQMETAVLSTSLPLLATNVGANYLEFDDTDATIVSEVDQDLYAIVSNIKENTPIKILYGPDAQGNQVEAMHLGNVVVNTKEVVEDYQKTQPFRIDISCAPAGFDSLLDGLHTGFKFEKI